MKKCIYCQQEKKSLGIAAHQRFCKQNPDRLTTRIGGGGVKKGTPSPRKGIALSDSHKQNLALSLIGKTTGKAKTEEKEIERKNKISATMKSNPLAGGLREGSGRGIKTWYTSPIAGKVYLRSTYELRYVKVLDSLKINWKQNTQGFDYEFENSKHKYYPDFYLLDENLYIEVKGFKTSKDIAKWEQFPYDIKIIFVKELEKMEDELSRR